MIVATLASCQSPRRVRYSQTGSPDNLLRARSTLYMGNLDPAEPLGITIRNHRRGYSTSFHTPDGNLIALSCTTLAG